MLNRKTAYLDFKNMNNCEVGHTVYVDSIVTRDGYEIFELHRSEAADDCGIYVKNLNARYFHFAISNIGIPYVYDIYSNIIVGGRLSDTSCRLDGEVFTQLRNKYNFNQ
ncbi:hypothetical protein [Pantoea dispersa]|uniref:hypothetical protein n=1 Tax=Pantoea dispersa TaxID=59814 RepID=UPI001EE69FAD|nr:hypothetical protein [Pantoea dispersa]MCI1030172.1 hypothetical protein [Pantoea dispersa]UKY36458.1 hypothetical protein KFZ74_19640 [Pantoea dispersa]